MKKEDITIESWEQFTSIIDKYSEKGFKGPHIFRGQSNSDWELHSSLSRILLDKEIHTSENALKLEIELWILFKEDAKKYLNDLSKKISDTDLLSWWELMQHYGAPTRLLDWSHCPYVATYFAVSENYLNDAALYIMDVAHLQWIQSVRANEPEDKYHTVIFNELQRSIDKKDYAKSIAVIADPKPTNRMQAQKSEFLVSTELHQAYDELADEIVYKGVHGGEGQTIFRKLLIPSRFKKDFLVNLEDRNINSETLFPSLDGLGKKINKYIDLYNKEEDRKEDSLTSNQNKK